MPRGAAWVVIIALTITLAGCGSGGARLGCDPPTLVTRRALRVVTTVAPLTDIVSRLAAGTPTEVDGLVPEGIDSHTFAPSPRHAALLEQADVIVLNGLGLELPTRRLALANAGRHAAVCEVGDAVLPRDEWIFDDSFPESSGNPNPHLWTSPIRVVDYAEVIGALLARIDPTNAGRYLANVDTFVAEVRELDRAVRQATATVPPERRLLLTYHDAYAYFAADYGWTVVAAVQPASFAEPSPSDVAALIEQVRATGVRAVFGSEVFPSPVLEQIAGEAGVEYIAALRDDDLPGGPGDPEHSWSGLMRANVETIVTALGGQVSWSRKNASTSAASSSADPSVSDGPPPSHGEMPSPSASAATS